MPTDSLPFPEPDDDPVIEATMPEEASLPTPAVPHTSGRWPSALAAETFSHPAGPGSALLAPLPLIALAALAAKAAFWPADFLPGIDDRVGEGLWLLMAPFVLATLAHVVAERLAEGRWEASGGQSHRDWSPRRWHYALAFLVALLPVAVLQVSNTALYAWLDAGLQVRAVLGIPLPGHIGYDPRLANLAVALVYPLVHWQAGRLIAVIPPGRLLGLQRELARLRGAMNWEDDAWDTAVEEAVDVWLADIAPRGGDMAMAGEGSRKRRLRFMALRKEIVAAWHGAGPPDLVRADQALALYRAGL